MLDIMHQKAMIFEDKERKWAPDCSNLLLGESLQARVQLTEHRQIPIVSLVDIRYRLLVHLNNAYCFLICKYILYLGLSNYEY